MSKQTGYTVVELMVSVAALAVVSVIGFGIYATCHFIAKFW